MGASPAKLLMLLCALLTLISGTRGQEDGEEYATDIEREIDYI